MLDYLECKVPDVKLCDAAWPWLPVVEASTQTVLILAHEVHAAFSVRKN